MQQRALVIDAPMDDARSGRRVVGAALAERRAASDKAYSSVEGGGHTGDARAQQSVRVRKQEDNWSMARVGGTHRIDVEYAWPESLQRPSDGVHVIYLDQKDWISLAKAASGHADGFQYRDAFEVLRNARVSRRAVIPLSVTHYMEMSGTKNARQRADVAKIMEELSGFASLIDRSLVMRLELEAVIDAIAPPGRKRTASLPLIGYGAAFAFGKSGQFRVRMGDRDVTDEVRHAYPGGSERFDRLIAIATLQLNRASLRGPVDDDDITRLTQYGWDPTTARRIAEQRARQEREQAARFDNPPAPHHRTPWRKERVRDVVRARYLIIEMMETVNEALAARRLRFEDVWTDELAARRVVDAMPSGDVCVSLMTEYHRNPHFRWRSNDIFDIDALSVAAAYCDFVVTDKQAADALRRSRVPNRTGSRILTDVNQLANFLRT
jgi:hypothetical protein